MFRYWDEEKKKLKYIETFYNGRFRAFIFGASPDETFTPELSVLTGIYDYEYGKRKLKTRFKNIKYLNEENLMQSIGFNDIDGDPIFEGDIVQVNSYHYGELISEIWWDNDNFAYILKWNKRLMETYLSQVHLNSIKILGNIYENKLEDFK